MLGGKFKESAMSQPIIVKDHASQERGNRQTTSPWNIVVIAADTLRRDDLVLTATDGFSPPISTALPAKV